MRSIKLIKDINAHISNIRSEVKTENNKVSAVISFDNLGYGVITAVKFNATGYNSFGDIVQINGKDKFYLIIQDIEIEKNASAENMIANMPNDDIRRLALEECQICFADGSVVTYDGLNELEIDTKEYDEKKEDDKELLEVLRDVISPKVKYLPIECSNGWLCSCGRYNDRINSSCSCCKSEKKIVFSINDSDFINTAYQEHDRKEKERNDQEIVKSKKEKRRKTIKTIAILFSIIIVGIFFYFIVRAIALSDRMTFNSENEMRTRLQGTYTRYDYSGEAEEQIIIDGDSITYVHKYTDDIDATIHKWDYRNGKIQTFEELIITKDGNIKDGEDIYRKGGYMIKDTDMMSTYKDDFENPNLILNITANSVTTNSSFTICNGSVKNNGKKTYNYIKLKGAFEDSSGDVVDTDWTYAAGSEGLAPGESTTFKLSVSKNSKIKSCTVTLMDYD